MAASSSSPMSAGQPAAKGPRGDVRFRSQFKKTELCAFHMKGWCSKADRCEFAHGEEEIQRPPDLTKTSLCRKWLRHTCELPSHECPFAHGARELRVTAAFATEAKASPTGKKAKAGRDRKGRAEDAADASDSPVSDRSASASKETPVARTDSSRSNVDAFSPFGAAACRSFEFLATSPVSRMPAPIIPVPVAVPVPVPVLVPACMPMPEKPAEFQPAPVMPGNSHLCAHFVASFAAHSAVSNAQDLAAVLREAMPEVYED